MYLTYVHFVQGHIELRNRQNYLLLSRVATANDFKIYSNSCF